MKTAAEIRKEQELIHFKTDDIVNGIINSIEEHIKKSTENSIVIGKIVRKDEVFGKLKELGFNIKDESYLYEDYDCDDDDSHWVEKYVISW